MQEKEALAVPPLHKAAASPLNCGFQMGQQGRIFSRSLYLMRDSRQLAACLLLRPILCLSSRDLLKDCSIADSVSNVLYFAPPHQDV